MTREPQTTPTDRKKFKRMLYDFIFPIENDVIREQLEDALNRWIDYHDN